MSDENTRVPNPSLSGIITNPSQQFDRIYESPLIWRAIVSVMVLCAGGLLLKFGINETSIIIIIIGVIIGIILRVTVLSGLFMLSSTIASKSTVTFKQLCSMNAYISIILGINEIVNGITISMMGGNPEVLFTNTIINWIFAVWITILTAFGLERVAEFSKKLAWFVAVVFIMVATLFNEM
ncbi:Yip1 family protein [Lentibacillus sp. CBA3610]|uniref:Yip1 family protein n=1 Tax=Lentibacillus sp. CBA3610 TaxID=2518176 RepID=UPI001595BFEA|nr:Yip1 family protein [Lentibacillus sp. CBA3610]QKY70638.1 hypothetical protein Len3610_14500 [Lentibacillus sp. CBA3610]